MQAMTSKAALVVSCKVHCPQVWLSDKQAVHLLGWVVLKHTAQPSAGVRPENKADVSRLAFLPRFALAHLRHSDWSCTDRQREQVLAGSPSHSLGEDTQPDTQPYSAKIMHHHQQKRAGVLALVPSSSGHFVRKSARLHDNDQQGRACWQLSVQHCMAETASYTGQTRTKHDIRAKQAHHPWPIRLNIPTPQPNIPSLSVLPAAAAFQQPPSPGFCDQYSPGFCDQYSGWSGLLVAFRVHMPRGHLSELEHLPLAVQVKAQRDVGPHGPNPVMLGSWYQLGGGWVGLVCGAGLTAAH
jgi:hypothetical protein